MSAVPHTKSSTASQKLSRLAWIVPFVAAVGLLAMRLHAFDLPLEADECNYAYIGDRLLEGDRLYVDVWDHQPPGVFVLFSTVIALFGDAPEVFRWLANAFSVVSLFLIFAIVRRVAGGTAAIVAAVMFALAASDPGTAGEGCNREIFMNTLILAAWYFALRGGCAARGCGVATSSYFRWPGAGWIFLAGCMLAFASFIKTIVAIHWFLLGGWILVESWRGAAAQNRRIAIARVVGSFAMGPFALWVCTFGYFGLSGRWGEFIDAVFLFNLSYSSGDGSFGARFIQFFDPPGHPFTFDSALPLWIGAIFGGIWMIIEQVSPRRNFGAPAILLLAGAGFIAVCLPARFWPHYYYLLIPPAAIVSTLGLAQFIHLLRCKTTHRPAWFARSLGLFYFVVPILLLSSEYKSYISQPPFGITVKRYNSRDFWGRAQGENIRSVTDPGDKIFVFGNDSEIYYYAQRQCASRFTMITGLQSGHTGAQARRATLLAELEKDPPRIIVVLFDEKPFEGWLGFLERYYGEAVGVDRHDRTGVPIMLVFARKDQPIKAIEWDWDRSEVGGWILEERM